MKELCHYPCVVARTAPGLGKVRTQAVISTTALPVQQTACKEETLLIN